MKKWARWRARLGAMVCQTGLFRSADLALLSQAEIIRGLGRTEQRAVL